MEPDTRIQLAGLRSRACRGFSRNSRLSSHATRPLARDQNPDVSTPAVALIHSPLAGPSTWIGVAGELRARGTQVAVPDIRDGAEHGGTVADVVSAAAAQLPDADLVLVGHSGAGILLPAIAAASGRRAAGLVFVDAHLPRGAGEIPVSPDGYVELIAPLAVDGVLPRWADWWATALERLVPDPGTRAALRAEMPRLPLRYFSETVRIPPDWTDVPCAYVRLSEAFEAVAADAEDRGWPVVRFAGGHLHLAVDPAAVAAAILSVLPNAID